MTDANDFILSMNGHFKNFSGCQCPGGCRLYLETRRDPRLDRRKWGREITLIKVLTGVEHPDSGSIELDGKLVQVRSPQHSQEIGISTVYQEVNLCTNISVAENIMLGHEPHRLRRY